MKSEFLLAFNEICQERNLPQDTVIEALKTALASAYRRNANVSNSQEIIVDIDPRTGEPTIYAEKEVVDSIIDDRTEVLIQEAKRIKKDVNLGDMVMVDSTPRNFGRIAAQTAKQVILQRVREAERDKLFDDFASREGEIVNGTVQSISGQNITIGLGRTEALLPKNQQVPSERYRPHDKIRVYVLEVRRTSRGPQIVVSRNHRNLLRRLLELEVPEIYNSQVDIKSIAREAGQRSKVAVMALQPGVDPVGACVGMRGVRIQSIVRELNDEKIDVIEWDNDQRNFIAKALSPARVSAVYLDEHPDSGKTAVVIVPDDQLSLAIGREGQNARLAAKLTGWRIDIKSLTEAAADSLGMLDHQDVDKNIRKNLELIEQVQAVLEKKNLNRPVTAEDYLALGRLVNGVEGKIIAARAAQHDAIRKARLAAKKRVPKEAWTTDLEELNLMHRIHNVLIENNIKTVGDAMYKLELGDLELLSIPGFGDKALEDLKKYTYQYVQQLREAKSSDELEGLADEDLVDDEDLAPAKAGKQAPAAPEDEFGLPPELMAEIMGVTGVNLKKQAADDEAEEVDEAEDIFAGGFPGEEPDVNFVEAIEEFGRPKTDKKPAAPKEKDKKVVVVRPEPPKDEAEDDAAKGKGKKGRELVFDENAGRVVMKRKRKGSRRRQGWEDFDGEDYL